MKTTHINNTIKLRNRFWKKVNQNVPDKILNCWNWMGGKDPHGYGIMWDEKRIHNLRAPRVSWTIHFGKIEKDLCVCHKCDNPSCVNPSHLFLGTTQENTIDMVSKKRNARGEKLAIKRRGIFIGEKAGNAKLTEAQVFEIKKEYKKRENGIYVLGKKYGVTPWCIHKIIKNNSWKHIQ